MRLSSCDTNKPESTHGTCHMQIEPKLFRIKTGDASDGNCRHVLVKEIGPWMSKASDTLATVLSLRVWLDAPRNQTPNVPGVLFSAGWRLLCRTRDSGK